MREVGKRRVRGGFALRRSECLQEARDYQGIISTSSICMI
jgi:hypothetical protein